MWIDECVTENGGCEDICTNTAGSYTCGCHSNNVNQSVNSVSHSTDIPVSNAVPVLIVISVVQTLTIFVLGITLTVTCCLYWKRGQQKNIPKPNKTTRPGAYTELPAPEPKIAPKIAPEGQSTYTYIDEDVLGKFMKSVTYPTVKSSSPVHGSKDKQDESEYMNLSDM